MDPELQMMSIVDSLAHIRDEDELKEAAGVELRKFVSDSFNVDYEKLKATLIPTGIRKFRVRITLEDKPRYEHTVEIDRNNRR